MSGVNEKKPQAHGEGAQKFCPLVAYISPMQTKARVCGREKCGWWNKTYQECAVAVLAAFAAFIANAIYVKTGRIQKKEVLHIGGEW